MESTSVSTLGSVEAGLPEWQTKSMRSSVAYSRHFSVTAERLFIGGGFDLDQRRSVVNLLTP